jgi:uncharacterized protein with HEPN domain
MSDKIGDKQRLEHILEAIAYIEQFTNKFTFELFNNDVLVRKGTERELITIGEASNALSETLKEKFSDIEWKKIKGFRNFIIHEYFGSSVQIIWRVIIDELPKLKAFAEAALKDLK